jgi:hypothetical protein
MFPKPSSLSKQFAQVHRAVPSCPSAQQNVRGNGRPLAVLTRLKQPSTPGLNLAPERYSRA